MSKGRVLRGQGPITRFGGLGRRFGVQIIMIHLAWICLDESESQIMMCLGVEELAGRPACKEAHHPNFLAPLYQCLHKVFVSVHK